MHPLLLNKMCCPACRGELICQPHNIKEDDIYEGTISCKHCQKKYPIREGVPIMLIHLEQNMHTVRKSFSTQWEIHRNLNEKNIQEKIYTWGLEAQERKKIFLEQMNITEKQLKNRWLLDAGCGNGLLTIALGEYEMDVVGLDLTDSVFFANKNNKNPRVHFVQGDVMNPPFKDAFDFVFSCGVLHHTYNTRKAFNGIAKCVKSGGRMWVWLYLKISEIECKNWIYENKAKLYIYDILNKIIARLPTRIQDTILLATIPIYIVKQELEIITGIKKFDPTNQYLKRREHWKDKLVMLHDNFTPLYAYRYIPEEVIGWYYLEGFENINYNYKSERGGFGIYADKQK